MKETAKKIGKVVGWTSVMMGTLAGYYYSYLKLVATLND